MSYLLVEPKSKKDEILNALFKCIYENGISGITMRQIAEEANINLGSLHYYFKSKENLLIEFNEALFNRFIDDVKARYQSSDSPETKLDAFFYSGRTFAFEQKELFIVLIDVWSLSIRNSQMRANFCALYEKLAGVMDEILEEGRKLGVFNRIERQTLSRFYVSYVEGAGLDWNMRGGDCDVDALFELMITTLKKKILKRA